MDHGNFYLICCLVVVTGQLAFSGGEPIVEILQGKLRGLEGKSRSGQPYFAFLGIPFVDKPDRFEAPSLEPPSPWKGIRNATAHGPMCIHYNVVFDKINGQEDCLFVNVYTRELKGKLPVMVYIHGGGFQFGTSHIQGPKFLMDHEVVFVTFNYRLGAFGFLSTGDSVIQGNMGMKDQVAALKWVKNNIAHFGGDPEMITIFGESAGGAAVSLQMLSPMSKGLFHRAISQSGAALNPWACLKNPKYHMKELADNVGCPSKDSKELRKCLLGKSAKELVAHSYAKWHLDPTVPFGPVVETLRPGQTEEDVFLAQSPYEIIKGGQFSNVPWIVGVTKDEGAYFHSSSILKEPNLLHDVNSDWNRVAPISLTFYDDPNTSQEEISQIATKIKRFYFNDSKIDETTRQALTNMYSDRYFIHGVRTTAKLMAQQNATVYPYIFTYEGNFSFVQQRGFDRPMGVTHKDDLHYLFDVLAPDPQEGRDAEFSKHFVQLWVDFANTGTPTPTWGSVKPWPPIESTQAEGSDLLHWFVIDEETAVVEEPFIERMTFWDTMLDRHPILSYPRGNLSPSQDAPSANTQEHQELKIVASSEDFYMANSIKAAVSKVAASCASVSYLCSPTRCEKDQARCGTRYG